METLKHPACTVGWDSVAAGFRRGKRPKSPMEEIPVGQYSCKKQTTTTTTKNPCTSLVMYSLHIFDQQAK